ncbi:SRPBCC family protein [Methylobacterium oryzisoli]|uniref:SRPBCC family protein n=1 Tax=Methylobacterium oryzisoli TaxID=3385502 RepID=UPI0038917763
MTERVIKTIVLNAPIERVWKVLTDHREFGVWFRVDLDGPFVVGQTTTGRMTYPGHEATPWSSTTVRLDAPHCFAFRWPHPQDPAAGLDEAPTTLVEFHLEAATDGTRLTITESGFEALPADGRLNAMRRNEEGWSIQATNIVAHVSV